MTKKMPTNRAIAVFLAIFIVATTAVPYSKYNRSCKDIGCRPTEVCVMAEDRCDSYQQESCGRYPTCQKANSGGETCTTKICPPQHFCKTENGAAVCVSTAQGSAPVIPKPTSHYRPSIPSTPRPTPPTPPPRSSSFGNRQSGHSGGRNTIGSGSIWDRLFGGDSRINPGGVGSRTYDRTTSKPASTYYPGGKGYYTSHTSVDSKGNRVWTFSG